jgi:hypothetical protein
MDSISLKKFTFWLIIFANLIAAFRIISADRFAIKSADLPSNDVWITPHSVTIVSVDSVEMKPLKKSSHFRENVLQFSDLPQRFWMIEVQISYHLRAS